MIGQTIKAALILVFLECRHCMECNTFTVDPPENVVILDQGHLGLLQINWSPPASLSNMTKYHQRYQVEYFNSYQNKWIAIRTNKMTYSAQFDLTKDIIVRLYTLLRSQCTNGTEVKSAVFTELLQQPATKGLADTMVQNVVCVFYNMEYIECTWERSLKQLPNSKRSLYFWHGQLEKTEECKEYIVFHGVRTGCNFTRDSLPVFTDINICVNGSSPEGLLMPFYLNLQIQNFVRPAAARGLHVQSGPDKLLELHWDIPVGRVPNHCLEWEVEHREERMAGQPVVHTISTTEIMLTRKTSPDIMRDCFRVRSRMQNYCATEGFWSYWSDWKCHPADESNGAKMQWDATLVCAYVAVVIFTVLTLCVCIWALFKAYVKGITVTTCKISNMV